MEAMLGVEADGGQHYDDAEGSAYDLARSEEVAKRGVRILRFQNHEVLQDPDAVARTIFTT
jgi:very-short-patch-repair endonuclease